MFIKPVSKVFHTICKSEGLIRNLKISINERNIRKIEKDCRKEYTDLPKLETDSNDWQVGFFMQKCYLINIFYL